MRTPGTITTNDWPDWTVITLPAPPTAMLISLPMNGWKWWALLSVNFSLFAGGVICTPVLSCSKGGTVLWRFLPSAPLGVGLSQTYQYMNGTASAVIAGVGEQQALPFLPIQGDAILGIVQNGGDAATSLGQSNWLVAGERTRPEQER